MDADSHSAMVPPDTILYDDGRSDLREVRIEEFADGGVTVTLPARRRLNGATIAILLIMGSAAGLFAGWISNGRQVNVAAFLQRLIDRPGVVLFFALQFGVVVWVVAMRIRAGGRVSVVGIGLGSVYVDVWGTLFHSQFRVKRSDLTRIELVRWTRSLAEPPRCAQLCFRSRMGVLFGETCSAADVLRITEALQRAENATRPAAAAGN